jgi:uncharacterized membrane protein YagU involved in acid resistance
VFVLRNQLLAVLTAGIIAGILADASLIAMNIAAGASLAKALGVYPWIASVAFGKAMLASPAAPALGVAVHFCISIGWSLVFTFVARSQSWLLKRPLLSGGVFGLLVYLVMEILLIPRGDFEVPTLAQLAMFLIVNIVFFGMTVALVVSRILRRPPAAA